MGWIHFMDSAYHIPHIWIMILFFVLSTGLFHYLAIRSSKGKPQAFIRYFMGSTALRLFLYMLIILAYRFYDKPTLTPFAIGFLAQYLLFTIFEVPILLKELRNS